MDLKDSGVIVERKDGFTYISLTEKGEEIAREIISHMSEHVQHLINGPEVGLPKEEDSIIEGGES